MQPTAFDFLRKDSRSAVVWMKEQIGCICHHIPPREPGSDGERKAGAYMADILKNECGCANVQVESFAEHPSAFYQYFRCSMVVDTLGALLFFVHPAISLLMSCVSLLLFVFQFVLYRQAINPLFPEKEGTNVTAIRPFSGDVRQRVFLNGHLDAAWEFTLNYHFGGVVFEIPGVMALLGVLFYVALSICALAGAGGWTHTAAVWGLLFVPFYLLMGMTYNPHRIVPGANDNLSGCMISLGVLRELNRYGVDLRHTEVGVILTGSEEAGLCGAKAWCSAHGPDEQNVPTYILSIDTIQDPAQLMVNRRDLNGTVAADQELCDLFLQACADVGVPCKSGQIPLFGGASDAAGFTQGGYRSAGITGMSHKLERFYHTRLDTPENLNDEALDNCYRAIVELLRLVDQMTGEIKNG